MANLTVVCGPMFSGKSETLYRYIARALRAGRRVEAFLHTLDKRSNGHVKTHSGRSSETLALRSTVVECSNDIFLLRQPDTSLIIVEEAQFFDAALPTVLQALKSARVEVVAGGLDLTSEGEPFDPMPKILALADRVEKLTAICACGEEATRSYHRGGKTAAVEVGGADEYEARCYACWERGMFEKLRAT